MKNILIIVNILIFTTSLCFAKPKIVTSITPLASIISTLTDDEVQIDAVDIAGGCPHHYNARPSDRDKIMQADMIIYIDETFESFIGKLNESNLRASKIKLSDIDTINFKDDKGNINWHFWLDLNNILVLQQEFANILSNKFPNLKDKINLNLAAAEIKIKELQKLKKETVLSIDEIIVLTDSLEHFFTDVEKTKITKLYQSSKMSLKSMNMLGKQLNSEQSNKKCLIIDLDQNKNVYEKYSSKIVQLDSENWNYDPAETKLNNLFYKKYYEMINQLKLCL